jgi:lipopolysaccharide export system protein LptA
MARYWIGSGDGLWGSTSNWSDTSGGATGFSVPTASDDVIFDGNGNNPCTLNASARVCLSFTVDAGYTNTITHDQQLTVSGNVTLHSGYTIAGAGALVINATSTITSGGQIWPNTLSLQAATVTLIGDFTINGAISIGGSNLSIINRTTSEKIFANGLSLNNRGLQGTATIVLTGGTWVRVALVNAETVSNPLEFDGNVTVSGEVRLSGSPSITYISGIVTTTGSTLWFNGSCTLNTDGIIWNNFTSTSTATFTLTSNFTAIGTTSITNPFTVNRTVAETWTTGGIAVNGVTTGTAEIILTGGTWSGTNTTGISNNLDINGNATISGNVYYRTGTLTYVSGTITVTSSTLNITGSCTLNTNGMSWGTVTLTNTTAQTYTINSTFNANQLNIGTGAATTFAGTHGWNVNILNDPKIQAGTNTLQNSVTYQINQQFLCRSSRVGSIVLFTSNHASLRANLLMTNNGNNTCNVLASFTRIDASGGRSINTFGGTVTDCININQYYDYKPVAA